jgi:hypothetical protein
LFKVVCYFHLGKLELAFRIASNLARLAGRIYKKGMVARVGAFILRLKQIFSHFSALLELLELEIAGHHDGSNASQIMKSLCIIYYTASLANQFEVMARAVSSLHLYLAKKSPLDHEPLSESAEWEDGEVY